MLYRKDINKYCGIICNITISYLYSKVENLRNNPQSKNILARNVLIKNPNQPIKLFKPGVPAASKGAWLEN